MLSRMNPIRVGMVGGGPGGRIAPAHRAAMRIDGRYRLVAGAFSRDFEKSQQMASELGVERVYRDFNEMARAEAERANGIDGDGIEAVSIVTPHDSHHPISCAFLGKGIHVVCDKPLTVDLDQALDLERRVAASGLVFGLTHNYSGYPMVRRAAEMVRGGEIGEVRILQGEFALGRGAIPLGEEWWRGDPDIATEASVVYDLGTHTHHLLRFVTGLEVAELSAEMTTHVPERRISDNSFATVRWSNGATGTIWSSVVAAGNEHGLSFRIYGEKGSVEWRHEDPNHLIHRTFAEPSKTLYPGLYGEYPRGFSGAFAAVYGHVADAIEAHRAGGGWGPRLRFPGVSDGVAGVKFVDAAMRSYRNNGAWVRP